MSWSCRKAACVDSRAIRPRGSKRRGDAVQTRRSRWMFGRRMAETVRPGIVALKRNGVGHDRKRMEMPAEMPAKQTGPAGRHEDAFVAIDRRRGLRRTARHVALPSRPSCPPTFQRGHFRRTSSRPPSPAWTLRGRRRHHRPGNRSQRKARDHQDREQPAYGEVAFHDRRFSQTCGNGKVAGFSNYATSARPALIAIKLICSPFGPNQPAIARSAPVLPPGSPARASPP